MAIQAGFGQSGVEKMKNFLRTGAEARPKTHNYIRAGKSPAGQLAAGRMLIHFASTHYEAGPLKTGSALDLVPPLVDRTRLCFSSVMGTLRLGDDLRRSKAHGQSKASADPLGNIGMPLKIVCKYNNLQQTTSSAIAGLQAR
ncbi:hypothetical protein [Devosia faecipullorum]|uniref:hypothetical protein n=1 Tax=Devosia faecipullorum TaxID=2755039 RepID=UPI002ED7F47E